MPNEVDDPCESPVDGSVDEDDIVLGVVGGEMISEGKVSLTGLRWRDVNLAFTCRDENRMIIQLDVDGVQSRALLDTGSEVSLVNSRWIQNNNIRITESTTESLKGFGLHSPVAVKGEVLLQLTIGPMKLEPERFLVIIADGDADVSFILGTEFIFKNRIQLNLARRMLSRSQKDGSQLNAYFGPHGAIGDIVHRGNSCFSDGHHIIPAGTSVRVPMRCPSLASATLGAPGTSPLYFEERRLSKDVFAVCGVLGDLPAHVLIVNACEADYQLKPSQVLGKLSSIVEVESPDHREIMVTGMDEPSSGKELASERFSSAQVQLGDKLSEEEQYKVRQVLERCEDAFSVSDSDVGRLSVPEHHIVLYDDTPISQKPRRFPEPVTAEIERQCKELQLLDIIEPSTSEWSAPVVPIRKKDGTLRLCVDYRRLNAVTRPEKFPLPNLTDAIFSLHGVRYFSSLDLVRGYYQLPLTDASKEYTAFSTPRGHYQFKRLSFGMKNGPSVFQKNLSTILSGFPQKKVIVYIDDVLLMSETFDEHLDLVERVLSTLVAFGVKVKSSKCNWFTSEVDYLGHIVSSEGLRKSPAYVEKVSQIPQPATVGEMREFLGLANFQRKFVPNFSSLQKPLSEKTGGKRGKKIEWTDEMASAFEKIKGQIKKDVQLAFPDYSDDAEPLELFVDASGVGAGACLVQKQGEDNRVIAYASMTFSATERRYSTIERELAAIRWGVEAFRPFVIGSEFNLHTDHQPLFYLRNMKLVNSRLARTLTDLADFNMKIVYTPGKHNAAADALSRLHHSLDLDGENIPVDDPSHLPEGLVVFETVPEGGDSLFDSLYALLSVDASRKGGMTSSPELREQLVSEVLRRPQRYRDTWSKEDMQSLRLCRCPGQLSPLEVILCFCDLFDCVVYVHFGSDKPVAYYRPSAQPLEERARFHLQCISGVHYNPVIERADYVYTITSSECSVSGMPGEDCPQDLDWHESERTEELVPPAWCSIHSRTHLSSVSISAGDVASCALLDSGAQLSCVSASVVERCYPMIIFIVTTKRELLNGSTNIHCVY